jgi:hypothetical protein
MPNEPTDMDKPISDQDVDFVNSMHDLLGMDEEEVEQLLDNLDAEALQDLTDAIANKDRATAEQVTRRFNTEEEVNSLFRGKNLDDAAVPDQKKKARPNRDGKTQFTFGDDVQVTLKDEHGKTQRVSGTVSKPNGPEGTDTIVVRIKGKSKVVDKRDVAKLEENVIGMIGLPNLGRIQRLAGIQVQSQPQQEIEMLPSEPEPDDPIGQVFAALDTLEAALPNIILADLNTVRQRLNAIQTMTNESVSAKTRNRKQ